jgi:hypothetical protein
MRVAFSGETFRAWDGSDSESSRNSLRPLAATCGRDWWLSSELSIDWMSLSRYLTIRQHFIRERELVVLVSLHAHCNHRHHREEKTTTRNVEFKGCR